MDFTQDELFETIDRFIAELFKKAGVEPPPVDALMITQELFGVEVEYAEPEEDPRMRRYGDQQSQKKSYPNPNKIILREDMSLESQQIVAAKLLAKKLLPQVLTKLGVHPETENRQANAQIANLIVPRLLLPTRWISGDFNRAGFDLLEIKEKYTTASFEMIALRMLDLDEPCVIAIVDDDGSISYRKSNRFQAPRKLTEAEIKCREKILKNGEPARSNGSGWVVWGWPTMGLPFRRIIFRSVPDDV